MNFASFDAVLLDLDGTIYHEEHPLPGAVDLVHRLQRENIKFACISNSTTSGHRLSQRLARMGMDIPPNKIYTAAEAVVDYIQNRIQNRDATGFRAAENRAAENRDATGFLPRVFNLATEGLEEMLTGKVTWVQSPSEPCDLVIAGTPANVYANEQRQIIALALLRNGAALVGVCADRVYPSPRGIEFGSGAFCAMLATAANVPTTFCGKPQPVFFNKLCEKLSVSPTRCLLIGDNLESDIAGGKSVGMKTLLVLTGVATKQHAENAPATQTADWIINDLTFL